MPKVREYKGLNYTYSDIGVPSEELLSEDYIQHVITTDMTSLVGGIEGKGKIPMADPITGKISPSWLYDDVVATTLPKADETTAIQINNDDVAMTPKATYQMITNLIKDASLTQKGVVQLTDTIAQNDSRVNVAVTPKALKNALANNFVSATYDVYGITKYANDTIIKTLQTTIDNNPTSVVDSSDNIINSTSMTPNKMYDFISNNNLNLNFKNRRGTNTKGYAAVNFRNYNSSSDIYELKGRIGATGDGEVRIKSYTNQRIVVGQSETISGAFNSNRSLVLMDTAGNTQIPNILYSSVSGSDYLPPRLGNKSYGGAVKPIYLENGVIKEGSEITHVASADAFRAAKEVTLTGAVTGSVSSTAGWNVPTIWRSCMVGQSGSSTTNPWYKVASITLSSENSDSIADFLVEDTYNSHKYGILKVHIRTNGNKVVQTEATELTWLIQTGFTFSDFVLVCPTTAAPTCELWTRVATGYMKRRFVVMSEGDRNYTNTKWVLLNASSAGQAASITTSGTQIVSTQKGIAIAEKDTAGRVIKDSYSLTSHTHTSANITDLKTTIVNMIYPIGSIYMSISDTSPATLFGGTWVKIEGSFLLGSKGTTYKVNTTGGSSSVSIAIANLPSHDHTLTETSTDHTHTVTINAGGKHAHTASGGSVSSAGAHKHDRGNMEIEGWFYATDNNGSDINVGGAFSAENIGSGDDGNHGGELKKYTLKASTNWSGETSEAKSHTHTISGITIGESSTHTHTGSLANAGGRHTHTVGNTGSGNALTLPLPPYTVVHIWKRTA